jgi:hypothetical protein
LAIDERGRMWMRLACGFLCDFLLNLCSQPVPEEVRLSSLLNDLFLYTHIFFGRNRLTILFVVICGGSYAWRFPLLEFGPRWSLLLHAKEQLMFEVQLLKGLMTIISGPM